MKDFKKLIKEALTPHYLRENKKFEVGDKVTYLGHPGVITATEKDPIGRDFVSISYDKGTGKRKVRMILAKSDVVKAVNETKYRVEFTTQDGEKAKSRVYNSEKEADKKEKQLVDSGIKKAKVVKVEESINEGAKKYFGVFRKGGNMGQGNEKLVYSFVDKEEAKQRAKRLRNTLSPGEKSYYGMTYIVKPTDVEPESINENEAPVKVGDKLKMAYQGSTVRGKTGVVTSVSDDMAQVDFGGGDSYGILFNRIRGNEIINEQDDLDKKYGKSFMDKLEAEIILKQQLGDLKSEREQIMIDMEQEAEPEGGKIADEYGSRLNDIDSRMKLIQKDIDDLRMYESVNEDALKDAIEKEMEDNKSKFKTSFPTRDLRQILNTENPKDLPNSAKKVLDKLKKKYKINESVNEAGVDISLGIGVMDKVKELYQNKDIRGLMDFRKRFDYPKASMKVKKLVPKLIDDLLMKQQMDHDKETLRKERGLEESVKMPSQKDVNDFFSDTFDEIHYLNSKPVEDWDEYDLSNWAARVRKSGPDYLGLLEESKGDKEIKALEKEAEKYPKTDSRYKVIQKKIGDLKSDKDYALPGSKADKKFSDIEDEMERLLNKGVGYKSSLYSNFMNEDEIDEELFTPNEMGAEAVEKEMSESLRKSLKEALNKRLSK